MNIYTPTYLYVKHEHSNKISIANKGKKELLVCVYIVEEPWP